MYSRGKTPGQQSAATAAKMRIREEKVEDYEFLRRHGVSPKDAAERIGVTLRTVWRYEHTLRERGNGVPKWEE